MSLTAAPLAALEKRRRLLSRRLTPFCRHLAGRLYRVLGPAFQPLGTRDYPGSARHNHGMFVLLVS
jgi:hypothetical protein